MSQGEEEKEDGNRILFPTDTSGNPKNWDFIPANPDTEWHRPTEKSKGPLRTLVLAIAAFLFYYLVWGILDALGGVRNFLDWLASTFGQVATNLSDTFFLLAALPIAIFLLIAVLYWLLDSFQSYSLAAYYRQAYEEQRIMYQKYVESKQEERMNRMERKLDELLGKQEKGSD